MTRPDTALNAITENSFIKKNHHSKNLATPQNTLSFFLPTHKPTAEKKMKECFRQRFIKTQHKKSIFVEINNQN